MPRHLLSIEDLSTDELLHITRPLQAAAPASAQALQGTLAFLFMQPSLRTMSSFAHAGARLGLAPVAIRTTGDTFRDQVDLDDELDQLGLTSTCVVARTATKLSASQFANMQAPLVSAGDGTNEHPTQALVDVAALRHFGLEGKTVVMMGNVRDYRVHHSLALALAKLSDVTLRLLCPPGMPMTAPYLPQGVPCIEAFDDDTADEVLSSADFIYLTPTQHFNAPHMQFGSRFELNLERAHRVFRPGAKVLHPFPRLGELSKDLDGTSFDGYHHQTSLASEVRRRTLALLLGRED